MPPRIRFLYSSLSVTVFLIAAVPLYTELAQRSDIWWTPHAMLVPLTESTDRVEIYARGRPLAALLQTGQLRLQQDASLTALTTGDIGLRFNNWDRVRAERLPRLLMYAAGCGVTALMFLLVVTGRLVFREEKNRLSP